jgi:hypothetical protein
MTQHRGTSVISTRVTLRQTGVPRSQVRSYRSGWIEYSWRPLRAYFLSRA